MSHKISRELGLGPRTPRMVGRQEEVERLQSFLRARGDRHFVYYWAIGGLGKTRLLEEVQRLVEEAEEEIGPGFYSTGIIDLYHTDTHSSSDVERAIVDGLDPGSKYFPNYRRERTLFERLRERGADPGVLEKHREQLSELFIHDCRQMALDARKLIICFDTVELLQYESSVVEDRAGSGTVDTRIRTWLLEKLKPLANVLVIFAGRPKAHSHGETVNHQARLVNDMEAAFGEDLTVVELQPFSLPETEDFIHVLTKEQEVIPSEYIPIVNKLTGGRPIFLHLVLDLVQVLALELSRVLAIFDEHQNLVDVSEDDRRLQRARHKIVVEILRDLVESGEMGEYLCRIALMPKGVDAEILQQVLGVPLKEAGQLLSDLTPLSFVKRFKAPPGAERLHQERIFLHDEMYQLLNNPKVIINLRIREREVANALIKNYYDPHIELLEAEIAQSPVDERIKLRERLQKLQVERLYYLLVRDPKEGYQEYRSLTDEANRRRWVGFGMRLLDEFLRFYNIDERRKMFEAAGIPHEQVIRESTQLWVERFYWWAQYERVTDFARRILDNPDIFFIRHDEDVAIVGNICALWVDARAILYGYEPMVVDEAKIVLSRLPALIDCNPEQTLARARLSHRIGYEFRLGGLLTQTTENYLNAKAAFERLKDYEDELAILLQNLAFVYAKQGRMALARPLAYDALRINEKIGSDEWSTGLTLSTLAKIAWMQGKYSEARQYGEEALALFRELEDSHGTVLAYLGIAQARRRMAKQIFHVGRRLEEAHQMLEEARSSLQNALEVAKEAELGADIPILYAEQGRVYRELGHIVSRLEGREKGLSYYRQAERQFQQALEATGLGTVDRADILQDLAEVLFVSRDDAGAQRCLTEVEALIGSEYRIIPDEQVPLRDLPHEHFAPLGKVEMTRGQIAFERRQFERGLQHYVLAYIYFMRFSPDAVEKEAMIEYLYNHLREAEHKQDLVQSIRDWIGQFDPSLGIGAFVEILEDLLGV